MDRLYKFYFLDNSLVAECIGGQFSNKVSARLLVYPVPIGFLLSLWRSTVVEGQGGNIPDSSIVSLLIPAAALFVVAEAIIQFCYDLRRKREARSNLSAFSDSPLMPITRHGFTLTPANVTAVHVSRRAQFRLAWMNAGVVEIRRQPGPHSSRLRILVEGGHDMSAIYSGLLAAGFAVTKSF